MSQCIPTRDLDHRKGLLMLYQVRSRVLFPIETYFSKQSPSAGHSREYRFPALASPSGPGIYANPYIRFVVKTQHLWPWVIICSSTSVALTVPVTVSAKHEHLHEQWIHGLYIKAVAVCVCILCMFICESMFWVLERNLSIPTDPSG